MMGYLLAAILHTFVVLVSTAENPFRRENFNDKQLLRWLKEQSRVETYEILSSQTIKDQLDLWERQYPDFVRLTTSQDAYGLPQAGGPQDCPFDEGDGCKNYILTIQDYTTYPEGSEAGRFLPEVLWSGEVHGNERVGPTSVVEATALLLEAAACEALPKASARTDNATWAQELEMAKQCRKELSEVGILDEHRQWLARLVSTRRLVVVPTANALGYFRSDREENYIDPNRDFPFDVEVSSECMQTIAGRTLNEVFREHLFQLSLTFHAGTEVVSYEWGAPTYRNAVSPDDTAQTQIGAAYSRFAGSGAFAKPYKYGNMNDLVYPVRGGMEDWAYAGSWDPERVIQCKPTTYGGYPAEKTIYNNSTLRVFNMLIETSNDKIPRTSQLGTTLDVMRSDTKGNGHISRNIRLALLAVELVQPYLYVSGVNGVKLSDNVVPMSDHSDKLSCTETTGFHVATSIDKLTINWEIGGVLQIDDTQLLYAKWSDDMTDVLDCWQQPVTADVDQHFQSAVVVGPSSGKGAFAAGSPVGGETATFSAELDLTDFQPGDRVVLLARAQVDQDWKSQPTPHVEPNVPPQSHMVQARTNPGWYHEVPGGAIIQGRNVWYSPPVTLLIMPASYPDGIAEFSTRYVPIDGEESTDHPDSSSGNSSNDEVKKEGSSNDEVKKEGSSNDEVKKEGPSIMAAVMWILVAFGATFFIIWPRIVTQFLKADKRNGLEQIYENNENGTYSDSYGDGLELS